MSKRRSILLALAALATAVPATHAQTTAADPAAAGAGIWKAAVPGAPMHGEFGNLDPLGVAAGARIHADCSLNWVNPDDGKRYCFVSATSLVYFLDRPQANIQRARQRWQELGGAAQ